MAEKLTAQQKLAVENRGGKLLVSAAAGSGKTKVLVDRLIYYLTDPIDPANIDDFLIITYTKAAASELRSKIASKLSEKIAEQPENRHLQRQMQRLYLTKISTVHSFCSDIIREYAYMLDVSADFRVADENESLELQIKILDQLLENAYAAADASPAFCAFVDSQGFGRNDSQIPEIILQVFNSARCHPDPDAWLSWCLESVDDADQTDPTKTVWGKYLIQDLHQYLLMQINALSSCIERAKRCDGMEKPVSLLQNTLAQLAQLESCETWDDIVAHKRIDYGRLVFSKKCTDLQLIEEIKAVRQNCKDGLERKLAAFADGSEQTLSDLRTSGIATSGLIQLVRDFSQNYAERKRQKHLLDFGDLEHKMLDLLLGKHRNCITAIAEEIGARFREVMIDEYQDSNQVQDLIFSALTQKRQNCFMVGDVKQSIYQFRLADPDIFIEKYNTYADAVCAEPGEGRKIILSSNFRSSGGVIHAVNDVFENCMSTNVGGVRYEESEFLREGLPHIPLGDTEVELYGIAVKEDTYAEEAAFTADRIAKLLDGKHMIRSGDTLRVIEPEDIVILLRSPGSVGNDFRIALERRGISCTTGSGTDLLKTEEVVVLRSLLQVISNPFQDIPLLAVLSSRVFCFTADDLAALRAECRHSAFYEALLKSSQTKCQEFVNTLTQLRRDSRLYGLSQLIQQIFVKTQIDSIYAAMPDGLDRKENLQLFCQLASEYEAVSSRGLDSFLEHLNTLELKGVTNLSDCSSSGSVTIMSIHKSKGLEFPVVFLCGLSRSFNRESAQAPVLCDKNLGLGLSCLDTVNRVRYPSIAKRAISRKILQDSISEEMRVLYVAMTRAKDRLIMTYASKTLASDLNDIILRSPHSQKELLTSEVISPGEWILQTALKRTEAGAFFSLAGSCANATVSETPWKIAVVEQTVENTKGVNLEQTIPEIDDSVISRLRQGLCFQYPFTAATNAPSKVTATQLKGRVKDTEIAENTIQAAYQPISFRHPAFMNAELHGKEFGNAMHTIMQHISFEQCSCEQSVKDELDRLVSKKLISEKEAQMVNPEKLVKLFQSALGREMIHSSHVLREFKFSILDSSEKYMDGTSGEQVLLQGVVDCALIEHDGITIIDFKTDRVSDETVELVTERYRQQVCTYANALKRIYQMPIKNVYLYYFHLDRAVKVTL